MSEPLTDKQLEQVRERIAAGWDYPCTAEALLATIDALKAEAARVAVGGAYMELFENYEALKLEIASLREKLAAAEAEIEKIHELAATEWLEDTKRLEAELAAEKETSRRLVLLHTEKTNEWAMLQADLSREREQHEAQLEAAQGYGWRSALNSVLGSLKAYPDGGGDIEIMETVERLIQQEREKSPEENKK